MSNNNNPKKHWMLTLFKKDITKDIKKYVEQNCSYAIWCKEKGENEEHIQAYFVYEPKKRFSTLKEHFPESHIEPKRGTVEQAIEYIKKEGVHSNKKETQIGEVTEYGERPVEKAKRTDLTKIMELIQDGATRQDIKKQFPTQYLRYKRHIEDLINEETEEQYRDVFRELTVIYVSDEPGTGKTRSIMEHYGYRNVYNIHGYKNPFDHYKNEKVMVFDEFRSDLEISKMLKYLDGYPLFLPARYGDKVACYDTVFIVSNIDLDEQYKNVQQFHPSTYKALLRRIDFMMDTKQLQQYLETFIVPDECMIDKDNFYSRHLGKKV